MMTLTAKDQRRRRTRAKIWGTAERPRLNVHVSNRHIAAQLIDDTAGRTLVYVTTVGVAAATGTLADRAKWVGEKIAGQAKIHKIKVVVFDRGAKIYHKRLHALAEAARAGGLEF